MDSISPRVVYKMNVISSTCLNEPRSSFEMTSNFSGKPSRNSKEEIIQAPTVAEWLLLTQLLFLHLLTLV